MTRSTTRGRAGFPIVLATVLPALAPLPLHAGEAGVTDVRISALGGGRFRIDTTVRHDDTGWDHYANRWDVLDPDGTLLGSRELLHPHVDEQPFTRSLTLAIPDAVTRVTVIAHDSVHGKAGTGIEAAVPR